MAVSSQVSLAISYSGDMLGREMPANASNAAGSGAVNIVTLALGDNIINVPTGGTTPIGVIIVPPSGNANALKIKGVAGDTGVRLHNTEPSYIGLDSSVASFILNAGAQTVGVRLFWN